MMPIRRLPTVKTDKGTRMGWQLDGLWLAFLHMS